MKGKIKAKTYDFIFFLIKKDGPCQIEQISERYQIELSKSDISTTDLQKIILDLINNDLIYQNDKMELCISPSAIEFEGFVRSEMLEEKETRRKKIEERIFKIIPIISAIVFGVIAIYFNVKNSDLKDQIVQQSTDIDSLKRIILLSDKSKEKQDVLILNSDSLRNSKHR
jgi:hypothetical protein